MVHALDGSDQIYQALIDAGFESREAVLGQSLVESGRMSEALKMLYSHRQAIVGDLHRSAQRIDCLDYTIFTLKKMKEEGTDS